MYTLKKSLGQHFLKDENVCKAIVAALQQVPFRRLLEVGPGGGALTKYLLSIEGIDFRAIEIDEEKVLYLEQSFPSIKGKLIHKSILEAAPPFDEAFTVVGNFPYNISTEILFKMLEWKDKVECMIGMFQKEVAQRIAAPEGSKVYGVTSVLVQAYFEVTYLFDVSEASFTPPPRVKSGVIKLVPRKELINLKSDKAFINLVKTAFQQRRKTLRNACRGLFTPQTLQQEIFDKRAEQLSVADFARLSFELA